MFTPTALLLLINISFANCSKEQRFASITDHLLLEGLELYLSNTAVFFKEKIFNKKNYRDVKAYLNESHCRKRNFDTANFRVYTQASDAGNPMQLDATVEITGAPVQ